MTQEIHVIYHKNCADGFGAAWMAWQRFKDNAQYHPCSYGDGPPEMDPDSTVYILDFSFPRAVMLELIKNHTEVILLDHHKSAEADIGDLPGCHFDMEQSGAYLAWAWFNADATDYPIPQWRFMLYIEDRDLWNWKLPESRAFSAALASYPKDFDTWEYLSYEIPRLQREGGAMLRAQKMQIHMLVENNALWYNLGGYEIPAVNTPLLASEMGEALLEKFPDAPFAGTYYDHPDGKEHWSLRSREDFDVSSIAKVYGGGGHRAAAGFVK